MRLRAGFTIIELLVTIVIASVVLAGAGKVLSSNVRFQRQQDLLTARQQNMRIALDTLAHTLRVAGYGVPESNLATWVPWVSGFNANPKISTTTPHVVSVARCTSLPVVKLSATAAAGATTLNVVSDVEGESLADLLDNNRRRLIALDDDEHAHVKSTGTATIVIDTNPVAGGNQGLARAYRTGTPLCRVDVLTFSIQTDEDSGISQLMLNRNQGDGPEALAEDISELEVSAVAGDEKYQITLTAQLERADPVTGSVLPSTLHSHVILRNEMDDE